VPAWSALISGTVTFTVAGTTHRATISRGSIIYASGASVSMGGVRSQLMLNDERPLRRGLYTLTLTSQDGHRRIVARWAITIT
jgi:hypothetical protein